MSSKFYRLFSCILVAATTIALGGCAGRSDFMTKAPASAAPVAPAANSATIVFIRDSGFAYAVNFAIVDQAGNFLGDAVSRSHFAVQVPPGRYFFFARGGESTDAMQAEVAAGFLYHVRVIPRMGMWLAGVELDPIKPGEKEWPRLTTWLARTNHLSPLIPKVPVGVSDALPDWAAKAWAALSPAEQVTRTLVPTDGLVISGRPRVVPIPSIAAAY
jgi:hypothetical protein